MNVPNVPKLKKICCEMFKELGGKSSEMFKELGGETRTKKRRSGRANRVRKRLKKALADEAAAVTNGLENGDDVVAIGSVGISVGVSVGGEGGNDAVDALSLIHI